MKWYIENCIDVRQAGLLDFYSKYVAVVFVHLL